jgi:hypothetical protein
MPSDPPVSWRLAVALGALALARPLLSIVGAFDAPGLLHRPAGPLLVTAAIAVVWIAVVVVRRDPRPVATLTVAGLAYAVLAVLLNLALQPFLESAEVIPPPGVIAMLVTNALQGAVTGAVAWVVLRLLPARARAPRASRVPR